MMTTQHQTEQDDYFGLCPYCRKTDGHLNIGRSHWFFCREHRTKWNFGSNLFSGWRYQTIEQQRQYYDAEGFGSYQEVKPFYFPETLAKQEEAMREAARRAGVRGDDSTE